MPMFIANKSTDSQPDLCEFRDLQQASRVRKKSRIQARGKFLFEGDAKFYIRGVTYGTFRSDPQGNDYHEVKRIKFDFPRIVENGFNAIRTYTTPSRRLLDAAFDYGLRVMVGLPWEQHVAFLRNSRQIHAIEDRVKIAVGRCAGHPAVLCYTIGNEIPSQIVRWHGHSAVESFLERLYQGAKQEDPDSLVTYVNYPSTEYLKLPFLDLTCFNVYLESKTSFEAYLARLQNLAGDKPLIMAEIGMDSRRNGEEVQARALDWQIRATLAAGCAGAFVFAWTDEWHRGGFDVEDWDFGLTTREREPKLALAAAQNAFANGPFSERTHWPRISVVVCSYNGSRTLRECIEGVLRLDYPDYELIVVNDGSTDSTAAIADEYPCRLISTDNCGLSHARNVGFRAATGEIIAYLDDDAYPDSSWLTYLASTFLKSDHAGVGGPNLAPPGDGTIGECVANAPGGPIHVLLSDEIAEHIPGCNMAFRKSRLEAVGGFDEQFRVAGDDVDICWRLQEKGWTLGFSPGAMVWHHRRNSIRTYWKQQRGYGKAEALLEKKWPEKYNIAGHVRWTGQLYGRGLTCRLGKITRIYQGRWGSAPFQTLHQSSPSLLSTLPTMPEWYLIIGILAGLAGLSQLWPKMAFAWPPLIVAISASLVQAMLSSSQASFPSAPRSRRVLFKLRTLTACLHLLQPLARLAGRIRYGLTVWRHRHVPGRALPLAREFTIWSEFWHATEKRLHGIVESLRTEGVAVLHGGDFDNWDVEVRTGTIGATRLSMTIEEHGGGKQLVRFRTKPFCGDLGAFALASLVVASTVAFLDHAWVVGSIFGVLTAGIGLRALQQCSSSTAALLRAIEISQRELKAPMPESETENTCSAGSQIEVNSEASEVEKRTAA